MCHSVVVTAHWITRGTFSVSAGESHPLLFDYGGFPEESYKYKYDAPGSPVVADRICTLLNEAGIPCAKDTSRGWDHGVFVPMMLIAPRADIPIVAMSLQAGLDPELHIRAGQALASLRNENVLIIGSGSSFHNFNYFFAKGRTRDHGIAQSKVFNDWLTETVTSPEVHIAKLLDTF